MKRIELKKWTKKNLIGEYLAICQSIDDIGCYGTKDLILRDWLEAEIARRGLRIINRIEVVEND